jgi:hypothetical protein
MTARELAKLIVDNLGAAHLLRYVVRERQHLHETPEGFFVEIVLRDGSKLEEAENVIAKVRHEVEGRGRHVISIVRALWSVKKVEEVGPARGSSGGLKHAIDFNAILQSGKREVVVTVEVTRPAFQELQRSVGGDGHVLEKVKDFLEFQLSVGGAGYWDPVRYPQRTLDEAAASYVLTYSPVTIA